MVFSVNGAGKTGYTHIHREIKLDFYLLLYKKISSRWIRGLNFRPESMKIVEKSLGKILLDAGVGGDFLDKIIKAEA